MANESVSASAQNTGLVEDPRNKLFGCLAAIESLARLLQKAHEGIENEHTGVYGAAMIIEEKAGEALQLIGEN